VQQLHKLVEKDAATMVISITKVEQNKKQIHSEPDDHGAILNLLYEVGKKVGSGTNLNGLVRQIVQMAQQTLRASASSMILLDETKQALLFEVAEGEVGGTLKEMKLSSRSGIAGWVARQGKPLIVNDVRKDARFNKQVDASTGFVTRSIICAPLTVHHKITGVIEVLNKIDGSNFNEQDLEALVSVASTAAIAIENTRLHQSVVDGYKATIRALAAAVDVKDPYTRGHSQRVTTYALLGGASMSLSRKQLEVLEYAGILHDIGKIGIPDAILNKPASLTAEERRIIQQHSLIGANIINDIPFLSAVRALILYHHERYDGTGYPAGLKGNGIPIGARLLAIADAYDTMTTDRAYRRALPVEQALNELVRCSGTQFCPVAVNAFISRFQYDGDKPVFFNPIIHLGDSAGVRHLFKKLETTKSDS
jgi:HD-GYP domain-containing protein (c-di-GMP phosphodiesterase class II)